MNPDIYRAQQEQIYNNFRRDTPRIVRDLIFANSFASSAALLIKTAGAIQTRSMRANFYFFTSPLVDGLASASDYFYNRAKPIISNLGERSNAFETAKTYLGIK